MATERDRSYAERAFHPCRCGTGFFARRWRWIDADAVPELAARSRAQGPWEGSCPQCGRPAGGSSAWVELHPGREQAVLVLGAEGAGRALEALREHLDQIERRGDELPLWVLAPRLELSEVPIVRDVAPAPALAPEPEALDAGVPRAVGAAGGVVPESEPDRGAHVGRVALEEGVVRVRAELEGSTRRMWGTAALRARPVRLPGLGYPVVGVRLMASHLGRVSVLDAPCDPALPATLDVFRSLSTELRLELELRSDGSSAVVQREVAAPGLERNAALCLESAQAELATGEFPPDAFEQACARLTALEPSARVAAPRDPLAVGDYRYLITPRETWSALDHLGAVSDKNALAQLLEVDGFPIEEYEAIRKRVLRASVEHGICAPRRFWRRIVASGLARSMADYAQRLAEARAAALASGLDDLEPAQARTAWEDIAALCRRRGLSIPEPVREALDLPEEETPVRIGNPTMVAAGELAGSSGDDESLDRLAQRLRQPEQRLEAASRALAGGRGLEVVLPALAGFPPDELLTLVPLLAGVSAQAGPELAALLSSEPAELRQACAIVLAGTRDPGVLPTLVERLFDEPTPAWVDVARAIGTFGASAVGELCSRVRNGTTPHEQGRLERLARALAEVALAPGGASAVERLEAATDESIAFSARHALATLDDVREEGAQARGERPAPDETPMRSFARRAWEAMLVPEAEMLEEADLEFI